MLFVRFDDYARHSMHSISIIIWHKQILLLQMMPLALINAHYWHQASPGAALSISPDNESKVVQIFYYSPRWRRSTALSPRREAMRFRISIREFEITV